MPTELSQEIERFLGPTRCPVFRGWCWTGGPVSYSWIRAAAVAFLARAIEWHDGVVDSCPRLQPLRVPRAPCLMMRTWWRSEKARVTEWPQVRALAGEFRCEAFGARL